MTQISKPGRTQNARNHEVLKKTLLIVLVFSMMSTLTFADMTLVQKIQTGPMMGQPAHTDTMTWTIKGSKARIDFSSRKISQIIDLDAHKTYKIDTAKKEILVMSTDLTKETSDVISGIASETKMDIRKSGKTETIQGYKCDEYVTTISGPMEMSTSSWVTQDIDAEEIEAFQRFGRQMSKMSGIKSSMTEVKGLPIRSTSKMTLMGQVIDSSTEMESLSHEPVSASLFELPKDFKQLEMPKMPAHKPQR